VFIDHLSFWLGLSVSLLCFEIKTLRQGCTNPGHLIFMVAPNINGTLVWNFLDIVLLAPRFLENL
jgi:hypothetical protein